MPTTPICVDANIVLPLVLEGPVGSTLVGLWRRWEAEGRSLVAPTLLFYEIANVLRRYVVRGEINHDEALEALDAALRLQIAIHNDADLHRRALVLSREHNLNAAYDAHYLALAERLQGEFWTADRRLYQAVQDSLPWIRLVQP